MNRTKKMLIGVGVIATATLGVQVIGQVAAFAHDAPPHGTASCTDSDTWQVTDGSATTENTGGTAVHVVISSTAGTVSQSNGSVTGDGHTITFSVTGISVSTNSITVTAKTTWTDGGGGTDNHTTSINKPSGGCTGSLPIPEAPVPAPPTCDAAGHATVPDNTTTVHWSLNGNVATATAQGNNKFSDGHSTETFTENVLPKLTGDQCASTVNPVSPTITQPACTGPGTSSQGSFTLPADGDGITYSESGNVVTAVADTTHKFTSAPSGWTLVDSHHETYAVSYTSAGDCLVKAVPVAPTVIQAQCDGPGTSSGFSITPGTTTGITYSVSGDVVTATLASGYRFPVAIVNGTYQGWTGQQDGTATYTVVPVFPGDCLVEALPVAPVIVQSVCTGPGTSSTASVTPIDTTGIVYTVSVDLSTVTADTTSGYKLAALPTGWTKISDTEATFATDLVSAGACTVNATPVAPKVTQAVCDASTGVDSQPTVTLVAVKGIDYAEVGEVEQGGTVTVLAQPQSGYTLVAADGWTLNQDGTATLTVALANVPCEKPTSPPKPTPPAPKPPVHHAVPHTTPPTHLASTGVATGGVLLWGAGLAILGMVMLSLGTRRTGRH